MFVLIHGGAHSSRCWEPTVPLLDGPVLAIDLPGRGAHPAPLDAVRLEWSDGMEPVRAEVQCGPDVRVVFDLHAIPYPDHVVSIATEAAA